MKNKNSNRLSKLKEHVNVLINQLFEDIVSSAQNYDPYKVPVHGIPHPEIENPVNLFKRQLQIEETSFYSAHIKYRQSLHGLLKIGRADQLAASHRYILAWMKTLENSISEQQRIFVKQGSLD